MTAGILVIPVTFLVAVSGLIYLFKPQVESILYRDVYEVPVRIGPRLSASLVTSYAQTRYPEANIKLYRPAFDVNYSARVELEDKGSTTIVYIDTFLPQVVGEHRKSQQFMQRVRKFHSEIFLGKYGNFVVELVASWTLVLVLTGLYIWLPRYWESNISRGYSRLWWRRVHAWLGFASSFFLAIFVLTGLGWSMIWGAAYKQILRYSGQSSPGFGASGYYSTMPEDADEVKKVPLHFIEQIAHAQTIISPFVIRMPFSKKGVYTVVSEAHVPQDIHYLRLDQYNGSTVNHSTLSDYPFLAKIRTIGIAFHEGRYFGIANKAIAILTCLSLIGLNISGVMMWFARKRKMLPWPREYSSLFWMLALPVCVFLPTVGLSVVTILTIRKIVRVFRINSSGS